MISKALEVAIISLQAAVNATVPDATTTTNVTDTTPVIDQAAIDAQVAEQLRTDLAAYYGSFAVQFAAFVYLGLGLAYTFFGAKFVALFISLLSGLLVGSIPILINGTSAVSTGVTIASVALFGIASFGCWHLHKTHSAILGMGVGAYVGSLAWALIFSQFTAQWVKFLFEIVAGTICAWYGYHHAKKFMVHATSFLGANMIATAITLFTQDAAGPYGNFGIQVGCILVFGFAGHHVQKKLGFENAHKNEEIHQAAADGHFVEHKDEKMV